MKIFEIQASAGRTFNHPYESYSNLRPHVTLKATLGDGEDPIIAAAQLQSVAEDLVEAQKQRMLRDLEDLQRIARREATMHSLERTIREAQAELAQLQGLQLAKPPGDDREEWPGPEEGGPKSL
jgi:hypothetical protein